MLRLNRSGSEAVDGAFEVHPGPGDSAWYSAKRASYFPLKNPI
jgi:hypothetical protein